jgi:hypothetical protein
MAEMRNVRRQPITIRRDCTLGVIAFKQLSWREYVARIVDIHRQGVGIELSTRVEPGFVWFKDRVWGHRGGLLLWSNQIGDRYRAGIKFLPLSPDEERDIQTRVEVSGIRRTIINPEKIITSLIDSLKNDAR